MSYQIKNITSTSVTSSQQSTPQIGADHSPIVFFDGECVMCNRFVDLMIRLDPSARIFLAPLQGETAQQYLPTLPSNQKEWTIYYLDQSGLYDRSDAFVQICLQLENWVSVLSLVRLIPRPIRDYIYRLIASNRYQLFGRLEHCRIPTEEEKKRFLP